MACNNMVKRGGKMVTPVDIYMENYSILREQASKKRYFIKDYINQILDLAIQKDKFLERYAPFLSVDSFIDDRITLLDSNPSSKFKYIDVKVRDHELICEQDETTDCVHCHFVWAIPEIAKLNLKKPPEIKVKK
jgi:hypothetical protein